MSPLERPSDETLGQIQWQSREPTPRATRRTGLELGVFRRAAIESARNAYSAADLLGKVCPWIQWM